jgi:ABC-type bacteriocin/lantibiotic exporter with double-glycine peptidase domain
LDRISEISFEKISFKYDEKNVLDAFSYRFHAGESYVIIGPSGVGKSTLLDLLLKFYPVAEGEIFVNGLPLQDVADTVIRGKIALMEQRVTIFNESILTNITLGADKSLEEVKNACRIAKIDGFIEELPGKYDSIIQYMGVNLSGGQRQRIALARAVLRRSDVLILDESLSALDVENKEAIFLDLKEIFKSKILISVSHDPWIVANSTVVLDFGSMN